MLQTYGHDITRPLQSEESKTTLEGALDRNVEEDTQMLDVSNEETEKLLHEKLIAAVDSI